MNTVTCNNSYVKKEFRQVLNIPYYDTIIGYFNDACKRTPHHTALKTRRNGNLDSWTYREYKESVYQCAKSILKMNLSSGAAININCYNNPEWIITFMACIHSKHPPSGVYTSFSSSQCEYVFNTSNAEMVFIQDEEKLKKYIEIKDSIQKCKAIVIMEPTVINSNNSNDSTSNNNNESSIDYSNLPFKVYSWEEFLNIGQDISDRDISEISSSVKSQDTASLVFTSGTSSNPKACMVSHKNFSTVAYSEIQHFFKELNYAQESMICYLSLAHIADQLASIVLPLLVCGTIYFGDKDALKGSLLNTLKEFTPTIFFSVPRVYEKMQAKIQSEINQLTGLKKYLVYSAMKIGLSNGEAIKRGESPSMAFNLVNMLVYKKLLKSLGMENIKLYASGASPISKKTVEFFQSIGISIRNCYGLSESTGGVICEFPNGKTGSIGKLICEGECKIADDGELLMKGDFIFKGYYNNQEDTQSNVDSDGWYHTGDIGYIDKEDYIFLTDRKKDIIITSGGENIAPSMIEGKLRMIPGVEQAVVYGDKQKFLVCLITVNLELLQFFATKNSYPYKVPESLEQASIDKDLNKFIQDNINKVNKELAQVQTIKRFKILANEFTEGNEQSETTATKKLRRKVVYQKYQNEFKQLYADLYFES